MATYHDVPATHEELACYCCGESFSARDLVRFGQHPQHGVCPGCAAWLHERSRPLARKTGPPARSGSGRLLSCSFCGTPQKQARKLIAGPGVFICDGCVDRVRTVLTAAVTTASTPIATIRPVSSDLRDEQCGFCGKRRHRVEAMAAANDARICNECLDLCDEIIRDEPG